MADKFYSYCYPIVSGCTLYKDSNLTEPVDDGYYNDGESCIIVNSLVNPYEPGNVVYTNKNCLLPICFTFEGEALPPERIKITAFPSEDQKYNGKIYYLTENGYIYWSESQKLWIHSPSLGLTDLTKVFSYLSNNGYDYPISNDDNNNWTPTSLGGKEWGAINSGFGFCIIPG